MQTSILNIPIVLGTARKENESQKVARYLLHKLNKIEGVKSELLDLGKADFPLLEERPSAQNPVTNLLQNWTEKMQNANAVIIVAPEYKSGYPGTLKNFLDYLPTGVFRYKPIGLSTVSSGIHGGTSCLQQLRQVIIGMAGLVVPDRFQVGQVQEAFDEDATLLDSSLEKVSQKFISELIKYSKTLRSIQ